MKPHHYHFVVFALDTGLGLVAGARRSGAALPGLTGLVRVVRQGRPPPRTLADDRHARSWAATALRGRLAGRPGR